MIYLVLLKLNTKQLLLRNTMKISKLIQNSKKPFFSLEFFPPKDKEQWPSFFQCVEKLQTINPLFASVTYGAGGSSQQNTLEIATRLHQMELETMAHLTCVGSSSEYISEYLKNLLNAKVDNVLALRGDPPQESLVNNSFDWDKGEFRYAEDLVKYIKKSEPQMGIGVAGYPAPHPESKTFADDRSFTISKARAGAEFIITQLFFDVREYFDLVHCLKQENIHIPVIPGILPVQSFESIKKVLSMCGANIPGKLYLDFEKAHETGGEEAVRQVGLNFAVEQIRHLIDGGAPGIHLYTLNRSALCLRLVNELKQFFS